MLQESAATAAMLCSAGLHDSIQELWGTHDSPIHDSGGHLSFQTR